MNTKIAKTTYYIGESDIEANAKEQLANAEQFDAIDKISVYPDIHYCDEKAIPVGLAFATTDTIFPLITGKDVGCGVAYMRVPKSDVIKPFDKTEHYNALNHYQNLFTDERRSLKDKERKEYMRRFSEMLGRDGKFSNGYLQEFDFAYKGSENILSNQPYLKKITETKPIVTFKFTEI